MTKQRLPPDDPREWLNRARSNLALASQRVPSVYLEDLCFLAQQAAEKALKAVLIHRRVRFPYIHDLGKLITLIEQSGISVPESVRRAVILSDYAVESRYPGLAEPVTPEEHAEALALAQQVVDWAERVVSS